MRETIVKFNILLVAIKSPSVAAKPKNTPKENPIKTPKTTTSSAKRHVVSPDCGFEMKKISKIAKIVE